MKIVSFELAQKLTELGYNKSSDRGYVIDNKHFIEAPSYVDVWFWLWREKKFPISLMCDEHPDLMQWYPHSDITGEIGSFTDTVFFDDPEEALVEAIDYIFENNLL